MIFSKNNQIEKTPLGKHKGLGTRGKGVKLSEKEYTVDLDELVGRDYLMEGILF